MSADTPKVLIADEDAANREALSQALSPLEAVAVTAASGAEVLERARDPGVALVVLDVDFTDMNGYQILNQMIWDEDLQEVPAILLSANLCDNRRVLHASLLEATEQLYKPVNQQRLRARAELLLEQFRWREQVARSCEDDDGVALDEAQLGLDAEGAIRFANPVAARQLRMPVSQSVGLYFESLLKEPHQAVAPHWREHGLARACRQGRPIEQAHRRFGAADGRAFPVTYNARALQGLAGLELLISFTPQHADKVREELANATHLDYLTGLPTRLRFEDALAKSLSLAQRSGQYLAVLFIDLAHFRYINETLGHELGDDLIKAVAQRVVDSVRRSDTVARLGGDEFTVLLEELGDPGDAGPIAHQLVSALQAPFLVRGHEIHTGCSLGIATYPNCGDKTQLLLRNADAAAYQAKEAGPNRVQFYTEAMNRHSRERMSWARELRHALNADALRVHYNPIWDNREGAVTAVAPALYWPHPQQGRLTAYQLLGLAEEMDLVVPMAEWLLERLFADLRSWRRSAELSAFSIYLPFYSPELLESPLSERLLAGIEEAGLAPEQVQLAAPESLVTTRSPAARDTLERLLASGLSLGISRFGTGSASLKAVQMPGVTHLSIDGELVRALPESDQAAAVVRSIIELAHRLGIRTVAEEVADRGQHDWLRRAGCDQLQGGFVSAPLPPEECLSWLSGAKAQS